jgi:hypothetical protein
MNTDPITTLINTFTSSKGSQITYDEFKTQLLESHGDSFGIKDNDDLFLVFSNKQYATCEPTDIAFNCKSTIYDKNTFEPIATQYNNVIYNNDAIDYIKNVDWSSITVQKCYEGTLIIVFNHNGKWYTTTRRCLDANDSTWVKNNSYGQLFTDAISGKFTYDELNINYCYHFVLVHHKNKNLVSYSEMGNDYRNVYHVLTTQKYTMDEVSFVVPNVDVVEEEHYGSMDELLSKLNDHNRDDVTSQTITFEGYVLKHYTGDVHGSPFITLKLQTKLYETLLRYKPNNSNIYQCLLELYQQDKLNFCIPFFLQRLDNVTPENCGLLINCIHLAFKNIARELSSLYFMTRKKNNKEVYEALPNAYKKVLFGIHGIYLNNNTIAINPYAVYNYMKFMPSKDLRYIFMERRNMMNDGRFTFINANCVHTETLTDKMFGQAS